MRTILVLVLSITALASAGLWACSHERTIDVTYSAATTNAWWPVRAISLALDFSSDKYRIVVVRGGIHVFANGFVVAPGMECGDVNVFCMATMAAIAPQYSLGGRLLSVDVLISSPSTLVPRSIPAPIAVEQLEGEVRQNRPEPVFPNSVHIQAQSRLWLVIIMAAAYPIWFLWRRPARIQNRRVRQGQCRACGYNLHGNTSGVCPECGCEVRPARRGFPIVRRTTMATCSACGKQLDRSPGGAGGGVCASCGMISASAADSRMRGERWYSLPEMRYQNLYVWNVLVAALDVMLTMAVIYGHGGYEVNPIAAAVIGHMGIPGAVGLKFGIVLLVIIICEVVGRRDDRAGRRLATAALVINSLPVAYTFGLLAYAVAL